MLDIFGSGMTENYDQRKVDNTKVGDAVIDTCAITDSAKPYETGIQHPEYNDGHWIIVETYDTEEEARKGHKRWVKAFSGKVLPNELTDRNESEFENLANSLGETFHKTYKRVSESSVSKFLRSGRKIK